MNDEEGTFRVPFGIDECAAKVEALVAQSALFRAQLAVQTTSSADQYGVPKRRVIEVTNAVSTGTTFLYPSALIDLTQVTPKET